MHSLEADPKFKAAGFDSLFQLSRHSQELLNTPVTPPVDSQIESEASKQKYNLRGSSGRRNNRWKRTLNQMRKS